MIDGRYTDEEWQTVLSAATWVSIDGTSIPVVQDLARRKLEEAATIYSRGQILGQRMSDSRLRRDQWVAIERKATGLLAAVSAVDDWVAPLGLCETDSDGYGGRAEAVSALENLMEQAKLNVEAYGRRAAEFSGQQNPDRERLYGEVLHVWDHYIRRDLAVSRENGNHASGPLVRFLRAVLLPIMGDETPKPNTIPGIVEREKAARKKPGVWSRPPGQNASGG